ncbi:sugar ABC transporter substrate-binding protein [Sinomonas sp. ASV486]|uniref:Sugar ABC transporter substrate-binding protein n=1 Tax=Sinomonas puerhi TaxID=3238584 RepID=A0AB39L337_9MICC|nr:sugar ABC transporter substrate-binding protein [Sinomonas sp. ASV486]MDQ4489448.1 sugar ABC transporter substrate-binding protein [Sinomonas sp. ASV486]
MKSWKTIGAAGAAALALALSACGTGGNPSQAAGATGQAAAGAQRDLSYAVVIHGNPDGDFWNVVKRGAEDAGKQYGVNVTVTGDVEGSKQAQLIEAALAKNPAGLVVSLANPDALTSALGNAKSKNVPFVTINSGAEVSAKLGALEHVGQTETAAGKGAGQKLAASGGKKLLCIIHEAGNIGLEQRCQGAAEAFGGQVEKLQVDLNNPQGIQATVKSKLLGDSSFDSVLALNPTVAVSTLAGMKDAGSKATLGSFDINSDVLNDIKAGSIAFTVDQQQYLQGYLPIAFLVLNHDNLNTVGGGQPVLTGPAFITKDNVATVSDLVSKGTR